jgi:hypothetical protein
LPALSHAIFTFFKEPGYILKIGPSGVSARSVLRSLLILRKPNTSWYLNLWDRLTKWFRYPYQATAASQFGTEMATWLNT